MAESKQPCDVFFETWKAEVAHLQYSLTGPEGHARLSHALTAARSRSWIYAHNVMGWSEGEAMLASGYMALALLHWLREDGADWELLKARLRASQERGRTELPDAVARTESRVARHLEILSRGAEGPGPALGTTD
jgi:hypothetical protein